MAIFGLKNYLNKNHVFGTFFDPNDQKKIVDGHAKNLFQKNFPMLFLSPNQSYVKMVKMAS